MLVENSRLVSSILVRVLDSCSEVLVIIVDGNESVRMVESISDEKLISDVVKTSEVDCVAKVDWSSMLVETLETKDDEKSTVLAVSLSRVVERAVFPV